MRYIGGKNRQAKEIVRSVATYRNRLGTYVEPFCGGMWSACAVMQAFPDARFLMSDANPYLICLWKAIKDGWEPPSKVNEDTHKRYQRTLPADDPMTAYVGFAWSFGGKFFGGPARTNGVFEGSHSSTAKKAEIIRRSNVTFRCCSYEEAIIPLASVVYLDPPYEERTRQSKYVDPLNYDSYYKWAEQQGQRATVLASSFINRRGWKVLHSWGDTVVRHVNGKEPDGTTELLMLVGGKDKTPAGEAGVKSVNASGKVTGS